MRDLWITRFVVETFASRASLISMFTDAIIASENSKHANRRVMANVSLRTDVTVSRVKGLIDAGLMARLNQAKDAEIVPITIKPDETSEMTTDRTFISDCTDALQDASYSAEQRSKLMTARAERHAKLFKSLSEATASAQADLIKALRTFKPLWSYSVARVEKTRAVRKSDGALQLPCFDVDITCSQVKDVQTEVTALLNARKAKNAPSGNKDSAKS